MLSTCCFFHITLWLLSLSSLVHSQSLYYLPFTTSYWGKTICTICYHKFFKENFHFLWKIYWMEINFRIITVESLKWKGLKVLKLFISLWFGVRGLKPSGDINCSYFILLLSRSVYIELDYLRSRGRMNLSEITYINYMFFELWYHVLDSVCYVGI